MGDCAHNDRGLLRFTTAGSVDDGKSSLIGRLLRDANAVPQDRLAALQRVAARNGDDEIDLSLLMDGLTAEREQGITIDVAYSYFATGRRKFIIADTPGHEQYTRNMVTGASTADAAVILIDATRGMTVQSRRHLYLSHLLGIRHLVVTVNKMDLVGFAEDAFLAIAREVSGFAALIGASTPHLLPISAKFGDNVVHPSGNMAWFGGAPLLALLESLPQARLLRALPFRFVVQQVRRIAAPPGAPKRQYLGRIVAGRVRRGDDIVVMPAGTKTRIRDLVTFDGRLDEAVAPKSLAIEVEHDTDIGRGDILATALAPPRCETEFAATICWLADDPFIGRGGYLVKSGTRTVSGRVAEIVERLDLATLRAEPNPLALNRNDIARVRLAVAAPLALDAYRDNRPTGALIVINAETNATVAAGMVETTTCVPARTGIAGFDPGL